MLIMIITSGNRPAASGRSRGSFAGADDEEWPAGPVPGRRAGRAFRGSAVKHSDLRSALQPGETLMSEGKLAEWQLSEALECQRLLAREEGAEQPHLGDVLVSLGFVSRSDLTRAYAVRMGLRTAAGREDRARGARALTPGGAGFRWEGRLQGRPPPARSPFRRGRNPRNRIGKDTCFSRCPAPRA